MSLKQTHVVDKLVRKMHKRVKRELLILEIKKKINNKIEIFMDNLYNMYDNFLDHFVYENKKLVYARKR